MIEYFVYFLALVFLHVLPGYLSLSFWRKVSKENSFSNSFYKWATFCG